MDPLQSAAPPGFNTADISTPMGLPDDPVVNPLGLSVAGVGMDSFESGFGMQAAQAGGFSAMAALSQMQENVASITVTLIQMIQVLSGGGSSAGVGGMGGGNALTDTLMQLSQQVAGKEKAASADTPEEAPEETEPVDNAEPESLAPPQETVPAEGITELSDDKATRIQQVVEAAKRTYPDNPVMAKLAATQALLESGIHQDSPSSLAKDDKNLFGIKAEGTAGWVSLPTEEQDASGNAYTVQAEFGKNATVEDSFKQHKEILSLDRYQPVWQAGTFEEAAARVREAGYATDVSYTDKLIAVYNDNLAQYF
ncbi:MAG: glucosaminidase domain-containing protein [Candidatus Melainabacteria bacterium]